MVSKFLGLMVLILCLSSHAEERPDLSQYFNKLDYFSPQNAQILVNYEAQFIKYMKASLKKPESELSKLDGKTLLYGTLLMANTNQGVRFKQIPLKSLSTNTDLHSVLLEREELILSCLHLTGRLIPEDYRIATWTLGHELYYEELVNGRISNDTFNKMYDLAVNDQFSYTAMVIVSHDLKLTPAQDQKMLELAQLVSDRKIPCVKNKDGRCYDPHIAPQTTQVGRLLTGDIFLKAANSFVIDGKKDPEGLRIKSGVSARVVYGIVVQGRIPNLKGLDWTNIYYKDRIRAVKKLLWKEKEVDPKLFQSLNYNKLYSCVVCHGHK